MAHGALEKPSIAVVERTLAVEACVLLTMACGGAAPTRPTNGGLGRATDVLK